MKKVIIILLAIVVWSSSVNALVCVEGNCNTMGYTTPATEDIADCEAYVKCPYDTSLKTCARYNAYPLTECPEGGNCSQSPKYKVSGCDTANGYVEYNNDCCKPNDCSHFSLTACPSNAQCIYCFPGCGLSGGTVGIVSCAEGYEVNSDKTACVEACSGEASCPTGYLCTTCTKDGTTLYTKTNTCATGYQKGKLQTGEGWGFLPDSTVTSLCYPTLCKTDTAPLIQYVNQFVTFDGVKSIGSVGSVGSLGSLEDIGAKTESDYTVDGYLVLSCQDDAKKTTDANGCITCSSGGSSGGAITPGNPELTSTCEQGGYYNSPTDACASAGDDFLYNKCAKIVVYKYTACYELGTCSNSIVDDGSETKCSSR